MKEFSYSELPCERNEAAVRHKMARDEVARAFEEAHPGVPYEVVSRYDESRMRLVIEAKPL